MTTLPKARRAVEENLEILRPHLACKGPTCWGCCRGIIEATPEEIERLLPLVSEAAWDRVRAIPAYANRRTLICPLLDPTTKLCSVYTERPLVCRAFSAIGDWKNCYPELTGSQTVKTPSSPLVAAGTYLTSQPRTVLLDELRRACPTPAVREIFVDSVLGNDETGDGSREKPFATMRPIFS